MSIADAILTQIQGAGQPKKYVTETVQTSKEPLDVGGLGLTLALLMMGMQNKEPIGGLPLGGPEAGGVFPGTGLQGMGNLAPNLGAPLPVAPAQQNFGMMDPAQLLQMIMSASGGATGGGLGGLGGF